MFKNRCRCCKCRIRCINNNNITTYELFLVCYMLFPSYLLQWKKINLSFVLFLILLHFIDIENTGYHTLDDEMINNGRFLV